MPINRNGFEPQTPEKKRKSLGIITGPRKDDTTLSRHLIQEKYKIGIFILEWEEKVGLKESGDGGVFGVYGDAGRIGKTGSLQFGDFTCHGCGEEISMSLFWESRE